MSELDCPICRRGDDESRSQAGRRIEALAVDRPSATNKRRARVARACFEPLSERASKIHHLAEAQRGRLDEGDMDMAYFWTPLDPSDPEPFMGPAGRARRLARDGVRVAPATPWWVLENA